MNSDNIKNSIQAVIDGLTPLAQKMNVPIQDLWRWCLLHNYAQAVVDLFPILLLIPCIIMFVISSKKAKLDNWGEAENGWAISLIFLGIGGIALLVVVVLGVNDAIFRFISPQYMIIQDISTMIKGH